MELRKLALRKISLKIKTLKDLQESKSKSKYAERDILIFNERLNGKEFEDIAIEHNISESRAEQIYNRFFYRLGTNLIDKIQNDVYLKYNEKYNCMYDRLMHTQKLLNTQSEEIKNLSNIDSFVETLKQNQEVVKEFHRIKIDLTNVFQLFDDKIALIHQRLEDIESFMNTPLSVERTSLQDILIKGDKKYPKTPYKCPICDGKGSLKKEVEPRVLKMEPCRACGSTGILWG